MVSGLKTIVNMIRRITNDGSGVPALPHGDDFPEGGHAAPDQVHGNCRGNSRPRPTLILFKISPDVFR